MAERPLWILQCWLERLQRKGNHTMPTGEVVEEPRDIQSERLSESEDGRPSSVSDPRSLVCTSLFCALPFFAQPLDQIARGVELRPCSVEVEQVA